MTNEEIELEIDRLNEVVSKKLDAIDYSKADSFKEFSKCASVERKEISRLDRILRMNQEYKLSDIPDYGDIIPLEQFIEACKGGMFINYDGFGRYVKGDKETNIEIYPSDVKHNSIRKEFDTIIWFNR